MRQTVSQIGPPPRDGAIVNQIQSRPRVRLLSPDAGSLIEGDTMNVRAEIEVPADMDKGEVEKLALAHEAVIRILDGNAPKKVIVVPGRIVNVVA